MLTRQSRVGSKLRLVPVSQPTGPVTPVRAPVPALDDSELLAAVRAGDPSASTALHDRVRPQIGRTICRLLPLEDVDHDDIAQLAMIELVSTIGKYRGDCALDSWTSTITARVVYKHIRRRKVERRIFGTFDTESAASMRSDSRTGREAMARTVIPRVLAHLSAI
ncbi:MAG: hypothetical protein M3O46_18030, partial [Myxococcota bacterium]|nr:hypothetical protein [Myxococcota bacterium]